jgi:dienelactone hydrolase
LPQITDYTAKGPFTTKQENSVGPGGKYTVYRPDPLGKDGFVHAPIIFGPGIGQQVTVHTQMLTNFASHGFIVVGTPVLNGGPGDAANLKSMQDGLDWILQQNGMAGTYQGKVWIDHAISMGFSVGGTSAVQLGGHQAVATVVSIHGHNASAALHGPMLQTTGTADTVGMPLQKQTYDKSMVQTFLATLTGAPHQYIESNGGGNERPAIVAWMRYWIYRDDGAKKYFYGDDCVLCKAPWENPQRKNWQ